MDGRRCSWSGSPWTPAASGPWRPSFQTAPWSRTTRAASGASVRRDGRVDNSPAVQAGDVHAVIRALGVGPVDVFGSNGGAVTALALVAGYPQGVVTLVAHEPPLIPVLPDAEAAERARAGVRDAYQARGTGAGMAAFIAMTSWRGEFTDDYFSRPSPDPAQLGMPVEDDGTRDDPLLSDRSWPVSSYRLDVGALTAAPTRIVIAVGEESEGLFTGRTSVAVAALLGRTPVVFPSHHGGFLGPEYGHPGQPEAFARRLREVLDEGPLNELASPHACTGWGCGASAQVVRA